MVSRSLRTRSRKKMKVRTPGGRTVTHFKSERAGRAQCGRCGVQLAGVATGSSTEMTGMASSLKAPDRPFGGALCPKCLESLIRYATRTEVKYSASEYNSLEIQRDLTLEKYLPRGWYEAVTSGNPLRKAVREAPKFKGGAPKPKAAKQVKSKKAKKKAD
jgi:large subunit ribosomal protein L34e